MNTVALELPYPPVTGNHAVRHGRNGSYRTKEYEAYRRHVRQAIVAYNAVQAVPEGVTIFVTFTLAPPDRRRRDADNLCKVLLDSLTAAGLWPDDSNKVIRKLTLEWVDPVPGGRIWLEVSQCC